MSKKIYEEKTRELIHNTLEKLGVELVDVEFVKEKSNYYLRIFVEKENGIDINTCEEISREFSDILDENDYIEEEYVLEISSPGDRPFKTMRDYDRNLNKIIFVKLYESFEDNKEFVGKLINNEDDQITLLVNNKEINFKKDKIAKACVDFSL